MPVQFHQLLMTATLNNPAVFDNDDLARHTHGGETVGDQDGDAILG